MSEVLRLENVSKRFGGVVVADDITLTIESGHILGLIGPNGAGKTSLFNLVSGIVPLDAGAIYLNGTPVHDLPLYRRARMGIARTWQNMRLFHTMSLLENLLIAARDYPGERILAVLFQPGHLRAEEKRQKEKALAILARVGLADSAHKRVSELPFGQQKLAGLARTLMNDGACLLLDEPMAGVEGQAYETMQNVVRGEAAAGRGVCVVEHNISFIKELCNRAVFMASGRIVQTGTVHELLQSESLREIYFGVR